MSRNSRDDRVSKKNNHTQQIPYDHLNLAERIGLATNLLSFRDNSESFDAHHFRRFPYTFVTGVSYRASTHRIHASLPRHG